MSFFFGSFYTWEHLLKSNPMLTGNIYLLLVILYPLAKCFKLYLVSLISSFCEAWCNYAHFIDQETEASGTRQPGRRWWNLDLNQGVPDTKAYGL